jgi:orotate phosphoribosyltransferase
MQQYQKDFISTALASQALKFGDFQLKSGRISPYFFNAGSINSGLGLATLGACYAAAIEMAGLEFDMLFGPAYKGIPLAAATAIGLAQNHQKDVPFAFNRKEAKNHGEGGSIVGAPLRGRVLIIDDVITAGTAIREAIEIIALAGAEPVGVVIGLDRQERGKGSMSAVQEVISQYGIEVTSIVALENIESFLRMDGKNIELLQRIEAYRSSYGIAQA